MLIFSFTDETEIENSETKQSESNSQDTNSDDERKRRNSADDTNSLEIKRERNENNTKIDGNDGESNTVSNGESNRTFYLYVSTKRKSENISTFETSI